MSPPARKSLWIPGLIVGFFLVLIGIEANLVSIAVRHRSSEVGGDAYEAGLHYDQELKERARAAALGWQLAIHYLPSGSMAGSVEVNLTDKDGNALDAVYDGEADRMTDQYQSLPLHFNGGTAGLVTNLPGRWVLRVRAHHGNDTLSRDQEIFVQP